MAPSGQYSRGKGKAYSEDFLFFKGPKEHFDGYGIGYITNGGSYQGGDKPDQVQPH
jgi:hypothetical protein